MTTHLKQPVTFFSPIFTYSFQSELLEAVIGIKACEGSTAEFLATLSQIVSEHSRRAELEAVAGAAFRSTTSTVQLQAESETENKLLRSRQDTAHTTHTTSAPPPAQNPPAEAPPVHLSEAALQRGADTVDPIPPPLSFSVRSAPPESTSAPCEEVSEGSCVPLRPNASLSMKSSIPPLPPAPPAPPVATGTATATAMESRGAEGGDSGGSGASAAKDSVVARNKVVNSADLQSGKLKLKPPTPKEPEPKVPFHIAMLGRLKRLRGSTKESTPNTSSAWTTTK